MQDTSQILARLNRLEASNRRWKQAGALLTLGLLGMLTLSFTGPQAAVLKGQALELTTPQGEVYASIKLDPKGYPLLHMTKGESYALVSMQGPVIHLRGDESHRTAYLGIDGTGHSKLELTANSTLDGARVIVKPDGTNGFYGLDKQGFDRFSLETTITGNTALNLYGPQRILRSASALDSKGNASHLLLDSSGRRRVGMTVTQDGMPSVSMTDEKERPRLNLGMEWDGTSKVQFLREDGQVGVEHP